MNRATAQNQKASDRIAPAIVRRQQPLIEGLESRTLMTGTPLGVAPMPYQGGSALMITGTTGNDVINVDQTMAGFVVSTSTGWAATFAGHYDTLIVDGKTGNDRISLAASVTAKAVLYGGAGNDILNGGSGDDRLYGGDGTNTLWGAAGNDILVSVGGNTNDRLIGGTGKDSFWADASSGEVIADLTSDEIAGGDVHRVDTFAGTSSTTTPTTPVRASGKRISAHSVKATAAAKAASKALLGQKLGDPLLGTSAVGYENFSSKPLFSADGPGENDITQGQVGDCYFLSVLSSVAKLDPWLVRQTVVDLGDGTYAVQFKRGSTNTFIRVDGDLPIDRWGGLAYAGLGAQDSTWVAVVEKAFAFFRTSTPSYRSLESGWMEETYDALGVASNSSWGASGPQSLLSVLDTAVSAGKSVTYATGNPTSGAPLIGYHAYTVDRVIKDVNGNPVALRLRNPWGIDGTGWDGADDGYVTITGTQALASMLGFSVAIV